MKITISFKSPVQIERSLEDTKIFRTINAVEAENGPTKMQRAAAATKKRLASSLANLAKSLEESNNE